MSLALLCLLCYCRERELDTQRNRNCERVSCEWLRGKKYPLKHSCGKIVFLHENKRFSQQFQTHCKNTVAGSSQNHDPDSGPNRPQRPPSQKCFGSLFWSTPPTLLSKAVIRNKVYVVIFVITLPTKTPLLSSLVRPEIL